MPQIPSVQNELRFLLRVHNSPWGVRKKLLRDKPREKIGTLIRYDKSFHDRDTRCISIKHHQSKVKIDYKKALV